MDASAIALARDNDLPIIVFSLDEPGGFRGILSGRALIRRFMASAGPAPIRKVGLAGIDGQRPAQS